MFPGYTLDELAEDETLQAAFGMALWGFGGLKEPEVEETEPVEEETEPADEEETEPADEEETEPADEEETEPAEVVKETIFVDSTGTEYDLTTDKLDAKIYWDNLVAAYGYDLSDAGLNAEKAGDKTIQNYVNDLYFLKEGQIEGGVDSIAGITTTTEVGDDEMCIRDRPRHADLRRRARRRRPDLRFGRCGFARRKRCGESARRRGPKYVGASPLSRLRTCLLYTSRCV